MRSKHKILPIDGARAGWQIRRQPGLVKEEGILLTMEKWKIVRWLLETRLHVDETYPMYLSHRIWYACFSFAPAEDFHLLYIIWAKRKLTRNCNSASGLDQLWLEEGPCTWQYFVVGCNLCFQKPESDLYSPNNALNNAEPPDCKVQH